jgi:hypothetical protein
MRTHRILLETLPLGDERTQRAQAKADQLLWLGDYRHDNRVHSLSWICEHNQWVKVLVTLIIFRSEIKLGFELSDKTPSAN